jgi:hypothetical protein
MNMVEARKVLSERLARYRPLSYAELVGKIGSVEREDIPRAGQRSWRVVIEFFWDRRPEGDIRVLGAIDDGGIRAFMPVTDSFIKAPSGEFVGE